MADVLADKVERLRAHCNSEQLGFYFQWSDAESCWYGEITSMAPEEEREYKRFSTLESLVDQMSEDLGAARS